MAGEGQEDVVEVGGVQAERPHVALVQPGEQGTGGAEAAVDRDPHGVALPGRALVGELGGAGGLLAGEVDAQVTAGHALLELGRGALGDELPAVPRGDLLQAVTSALATRQVMAVDLRLDTALDRLREALAAEEITAMRERIDEIDQAIIDLWLERARISQAVGKTRMASGGTRLVLSREREIVERFREALGPDGTQIALMILRAGRGPL